MKATEITIRKSLLLASPILAFLILWEMISRTGIYNIKLFPPPSTVAIALYEMLINGELIVDVFASLRRVFIGYVLGAILGISVGVLTSKSDKFRYSLMPLIQLLRPIPPISYVPLAILWFGLQEESKYFLVIVGVFFPIWIATHLGVLQVSKTYIWAAESLGASRLRVLIEIVLPAAMPFIITGMRTSLAIAFYCLVAAEIAGAFDGVAFRVAISYQNNRADKMLAGLVILGVLSATVDKLFSFMVNQVFPWYAKSVNK